MLKQPFYTILIVNSKGIYKDVTDFTTSFSYEDCTSEDDLLKLSLQGLSVDDFDSEWFAVGREIHFQFGYLGGNASKLRLARITNIEHNYEKLNNITITALDLGQIMKKAQSNAVYKNVKFSDVATKVAKAYNLKTDLIKETTTLYPTILQGNKSDFELLQYLAQKEKGGDWRCYIKDDQLILNQIDLKKESDFTFVLGENVISFKPSLKDTDNKNLSNGMNVSAINTDQKKVETASIDQKGNLLGKNTNSTDKDRDKQKQPIKYNQYEKPK
jgi:hypothetical protein